jgi:hypothetical protein
MTRTTNLARLIVVLTALTLNVAKIGLPAPAAAPPSTIATAGLRKEVNDFLGKELEIHFADIKSLDHPPDRVVGALTTGEFSWGTFMRALAAYSESTGQKQLAGRDMAKWTGQLGLIEARSGGKAFSQLYAALSLRHFGRDLKTNALWQSLTPEEQTAWRSLLNPERFYDPRTNKVINLPENYLGVASRIASISYQLGILTDRNFLDRLLDRAAAQFTSGLIYSDDSPPTLRYDRYSNEYVRYVWDAAQTAGRNDILDKLRPSLQAQMKLWWDLASEDGYGYNWGRSQGIVSYLDTPEIVSFLAKNPEFRPAPLPQLAALYYQAWRYLRHDYRDKAHLLSLYLYGRGNYSYINLEREWQQTTGFFGKLANSNTAIMDALDREGVQVIPTVPQFPDVARFEFFRKDGGREAGVWVVRKGPIHFALPITTGTKPGVADYLPSPFGFTGFSAPVEQVYPSLTPLFELEDGRTVMATDGADQIEPGADGLSLHVRWNRWAVVGGKSGEWLDVGLTDDVRWRLENNSLVRDETVTATKPIRIKHWQLAVPTVHSRMETSTKENVRVDRLFSGEGILEVALRDANFPIATSIFATGNSPLGRGVKGAIPLHLMFDARDIQLDPNHPVKYTILLTATHGN